MNRWIVVLVAGAVGVMAAMAMGQDDRKEVPPCLARYEECITRRNAGPKSFEQLADESAAETDRQLCEKARREGDKTVQGYVCPQEPMEPWPLGHIRCVADDCYLKNPDGSLSRVGGLVDPKEPTVEWLPNHHGLKCGYEQESLGAAIRTMRVCEFEVGIRSDGVVLWRKRPAVKP